MAQMDELLQHAAEHAMSAGKPHHEDRIIIAGDLNTGAHGFGRAFPKFARDHLRWRSLGYTEAEWWERYYWSDLSRNSVGFRDPFDKRRDITMSVGPLGVGFWRAKLDWLLVSGGVRVAAQDMGGREASDHAWLCVDVANGI